MTLTFSDTNITLQLAAKLFNPPHEFAIELHVKLAPGTQPVMSVQVTASYPRGCHC